MTVTGSEGASGSGTAPFADLHDELRAVARQLLGERSPLTGDGDPSAPADWGQLAALGWLGLEVPEALGGAGATFAEVAVVGEELGRAAANSPFVGTVVLGAGLLARLAPSPARDDLLRAVAAGERQVAVVLDGGDDLAALAPPARPEPAFALRGGAGGAGVARLDGEARFVPDAPDADVLLVPATTDGGQPVVVTLPIDQPGLRVTAQPVLDATRSFGTVVAAGVEVGEAAVSSLIGDPWAALRHVFDRGAVAVAADALGLSRAMLDATVAYAGARQQFGRPIGSFQAVKHACADALVQITVGERLVVAAVAALVDDDPEAWVAASMAKAHVTAAAVDVVGSALQLHGGIGYTWESGIHVYLKRAALDRSLFGAPPAHHRRLATRFSDSP